MLRTNSRHLGERREQCTLYNLTGGPLGSFGALHYKPRARWRQLDRNIRSRQSHEKIGDCEVCKQSIEHPNYQSGLGRFKDRITFYYIDKSVLLENTPPVKVIRNYIRDPSGVFSISSLVRILMTSYPAFSWLFVQTVGKTKMASDRFVYIIKIARWLEDMNFIFSC